MARQIRIAILGMGRAGRARAKAIEAHPNACLAGIVHTSLPSARELLVDLLANDNVDAAIVCTPNLLHAETARALLNASKHTAVEFPLAESRAAASGLFELASQD